MNSSNLLFLSTIVDQIRSRNQLDLLYNEDTRKRIDSLECQGGSFSFGHLYHLLDFDLTSKLSGEDVLEIGGAISHSLVLKAFSVNSWTAVQKIYFSDDLNSGNNDVIIPNNSQTGYNLINHLNGLQGAYEEGLVKDANFSRIFSIACFEHIHNLSEALEIAHRCLRPGGVMYSYFTPIWSSESSHLPPPHKCLNEPYYHLFYNYTTMYYKLVSLGLETTYASAAAYEHYKGESLNRYSYEEYCCIFASCPFKRKSIQPINHRKVSSLPANIQQRIHSINPLIKELATGFRLVFEK